MPKSQKHFPMAWVLYMQHSNIFDDGSNYTSCSDHYYLLLIWMYLDTKNVYRYIYIKDK
jgi:hypothetical protein